MNVLVLVDNSFPYGVAISSRLRNFCQLFLQRGDQVHVLALRTTDTTCTIGQIVSFEGYTYQVLTHRSPTGYIYRRPCDDSWLA